MTENSYGKKDDNGQLDSQYLRCKCGNTSFLLHYGDYCIYSTCTQCGETDEPYSG